MNRPARECTICGTSLLGRDLRTRYCSDACRGRARRSAATDGPPVASAPEATGAVAASVEVYLGGVEPHLSAAAALLVVSLRTAAASMDVELAAQGRASGATQAAFRAAQAAVAAAYAETSHAKRQAAVSAARGNDDEPITGLAPAFARFAFEEPDPTDPEWQPDTWSLFVSEEICRVGLDYVRRRNELLAAIQSLLVEAAADPAAAVLFATLDEEVSA